jgi:hypothetical protein
MLFGGKWVNDHYDCSRRGFGIALVSVHDWTSRPCMSASDMESATESLLRYYWPAKANGDWIWNGLWLIITKATKPVVA